MAASEYHHGDQDVSDNKATYTAFMAASKWSSLYLAAILLWLVLWFCTPAGFWTGAIFGLVVLVAGYLLLRKKPGAAAAH